MGVDLHHYKKTQRAPARVNPAGCRCSEKRPAPLVWGLPTNISSKKTTVKNQMKKVLSSLRKTFFKRYYDEEFRKSWKVVWEN
jgi:RNase H-fold protein (predicted Holliday junction resolvase)